MTIFSVLGLTMLLVLASTQPLRAAPAANIRLYVYSLECTQDIINDGSTQDHQLTPEECEAILHPPAPPPSPDEATPPVPLPPHLLIPATQTPARFPVIKLESVPKTDALESASAYDSISLEAIKGMPLATTLLVATAFGGAIILGAEVGGATRLLKKIWRGLKRWRKL
ncbi:MAG TPA: hypothetical protein VFZ48_03085 [Candidatus Saccharimonadales bacterium]